MAEKIKLVRGDTRPQIKSIIKGGTSGAPISLVGATVRLYFRAAGAATLQATLTGALQTGLEADDGSVNTGAPYNVAGAGGRVIFPWAAADLLCEPGDYEGEIEVIFADGSKQTVFELLKFKLRADLAN